MNPYIRIWWFSEWRTTEPPGVDELPEGARAALKRNKNEQIAANRGYEG